jgi:hypothetical protein
LTFGGQHDFIFQEIEIFVDFALRMVYAFEKSTITARYGVMPQMRELFIVTAMRRHIQYRMFENRVLNKIFELKSEEVTGSWRRLHNEEFHFLQAQLFAVYWVYM